MPSTFSKKLLLAALSVACLLVLAPAAMAQTSSATSGGGGTKVAPPEFEELWAHAPGARTSRHAHESAATSSFFLKAEDISFERLRG